MHLGKGPDPWGDRVRRLIRGFRGWLGCRRLSVILAVLVLLLVGTAIVVPIALVDDIPSVNNVPEKFIARIAQTVGLDPTDILTIATGIKYVNLGMPGHIAQGMLSSPERIDLDIAELDLQRLAYEREVGLRQGYWIPSDQDYVPVTIHYKNQTLHGKARLKGDNPDHFYGEKWSLRFKLDGNDRLDHMGEFGIQSPRTRNYMNEWLYQQALSREGVPGLSYRFVDVTINGKSMGTYALEQEFDDGIAWYNKLSPGPIIRFSKPDFQMSVVTGNRMPDPERTVALDVVNGNATGEGHSEEETASALRLLEQWRSGEIPTSDALDLETTARYFALSDLFGNLHGDLLHNIRFYYNPITARLEPVGYDSLAGVAITEIKGLTSDRYYRLFFDDPALMEAYLTELDRISTNGYLEALFAETKRDFQANVSVIYRDQPYYYFSRKPFVENRATIQRTLNPYRAISAYVNGTTPTGPLIDLGASQQVPVEVTGLLAGGSRGVPDGGPVRVPGKVLDEPVQFQTVAFTFPADAAWNASAAMKVECRVLGTDELRLESVVPTPRLPGTGDVDRITHLAANAGSLEFAVTNDSDRTVYLLPGSHQLAEPLVVPEGYTLLCGPGTSIDLVRNASIVARGPLDWQGTEERPIVVGSSDGTGGGVLVLRARNLSTLVNVHIEPLASPGVSAGSGVLTFLESPVVLDRVSVKGDGTAPLLRLVGGSFIVTGSAFVGGSTPAISAEYSKGNLTEALIADGSGLRVSGSVVELERCRFERIAGTAVLAERESTLSGTDAACIATGTGLAAESGSTANIDGLSVRNADAGVYAGRGETGFGPGRIVLSSANFSNVTTSYVQDGGGTILVDGRSVGR